ncbi:MULTISPECIES: hypothetical protein [unclassified Calothrix]|nr:MULTISPECIES: hypothetical protein [unclassified Calothrix]
MSCFTAAFQPPLLFDSDRLIWFMQSARKNLEKRLKCLWGKQFSL